MLVEATYGSDEVGLGHPRLAEFSALVAKSDRVAAQTRALNVPSLRAAIGLSLPHTEALDPATIGDIARRIQGNPVRQRNRAPQLRTAARRPAARGEAPLLRRHALRHDGAWRREQGGNGLLADAISERAVTSAYRLLDVRFGRRVRFITIER